MTDDTMARACSTNVYERGCFGRSHQCERAASVERAGKFFCKQHDPVVIKAKSDARTAKWEAEFAASLAKRKLIDRAIRSFEPMRDALTLLRGQYILFVGPDDDIANAVLAQVDAALALAE